LRPATPPHRPHSRSLWECVDPVGDLRAWVAHMASAYHSTIKARERGEEDRAGNEEWLRGAHSAWESILGQLVSLEAVLKCRSENDREAALRASTVKIMRALSGDDRLELLSIIEMLVDRLDEDERNEILEGLKRA
jgi:hypothetical protein